MRNLDALIRMCVLLADGTATSQHSQVECLVRLALKQRDVGAQIAVVCVAIFGVVPDDALA